MSNATSSYITSSNQVRDGDENCDLVKISNESEVSVVSSKNRVSRPAFKNELQKIAESLRKNGVELIDKSNSLVGGSLKYAARVGDIKLVELRIRQGADVNGSERKGSSPLHMAAWYGHPKIIELLIKNGARLDSVLNGPTKNGYTPLHLACLNNKIKCVKVLLKYGASVAPKCADVHHPIHIAVFKNYVEVAALLLDNGADVNLRYNNKFFHNKWKQSIFWKDMDLTLLHCSIARKYKEMTTLLLEHGADIFLNTRSNKTSLMHAVEAKNVELVKSFLAKGANPNDRDIYGEPVVFFTVLNAYSYQSTYNKEEFRFHDEKLHIIGLLCDAGADANAKFRSNRSFDTLIHYACMYGQDTIATYIFHLTNFDYRIIDCATIQLSKVVRGAISRDDENDSKFIEDLYQSFFQVQYELVSCIFRIQVIGVPVKEELLSAIHSFSDDSRSPEDYRQMLEDIKRDLGDEITYAKQKTIGNTGISFWHVLTCKMSELVKLLFQEDFRNLPIIDYLEELNHYNGMIQVRLKSAIKRSKRITLIEKSREIIFDLFHTHFPYDCCEIIATSFDDKELEDFMNLCSNDIISSNPLFLSYSKNYLKKKLFDCLYIVYRIKPIIENMSSVTSSDITSSNQVRDEDENVVSSKNCVSRPAFKNELQNIAESLRKNGVELIDKSNSLVGGSLKYAVRVGDIKLAELRIRQGANVNGSERKGSSPLHMAAWYGHPKIIELLINNGARLDSVLNGPTKNGYTPLHLACLNNKIKCVKVLLKYGASVTPKCADVHHPIHIAVFKNYVEVAALLLDNGADVNLRYNNKFFHNKWKQSIFWKDMDLTLLHCSIARKYKEMTTLLLEHGADIFLNTRSNKTSLMHAVEAKNVELVKSFLAKGANPNDRDIYGEPVVFFTVLNAYSYQSTYNKEEFRFHDEKLHIIGLLCDAGADANAKFRSNRSFDTLIHYACMYGQDTIATYIFHLTNFDYRIIDCATIQLSKVVRGAISRDDENDSKFIEDLYQSFFQVQYELVSCIFRIQVIGVPVKEELLSAIHSFSDDSRSPEDYRQMLEDIKRDLGDEITYAKQKTIGNTGISFWHVLTCKMSELVKLSFQEDFRNLPIIDYLEELNHYYGMTEVRWKSAIKRSKRITLIEKSREIIFDLFHTHLPYDCCEIIATSFDDKELEDFMNLCSKDIIC
ncbi:uncharacterized protein LOC130670570 [Microplitis mediator]|uniref:uncharacterized protein LOC130670570 n=1 Tax=Microplitis mediator TaxID=375433 RepID=UPI0025559CA9|nr:uncharacterized protein LOC130670570 [Microplitis mediator]